VCFIRIQVVFFSVLVVFNQHYVVSSNPSIVLIIKFMKLPIFIFLSVTDEEKNILKKTNNFNCKSSPLFDLSEYFFSNF